MKLRCSWFIWMMRWPKSVWFNFWIFSKWWKNKKNGKHKFWSSQIKSGAILNFTYFATGFSFFWRFLPPWKYNKCFDENLVKNYLEHHWNKCFGSFFQLFLYFCWNTCKTLRLRMSHSNSFWSSRAKIFLRLLYMLFFFEEVGFASSASYKTNGYRA